MMHCDPCCPRAQNLGAGTPGFILPSDRRAGRGGGRILLSLAALLTACGGGLQPGEGGDSASALTDYWQPFTKSSPWNLKLPAGRSETPIAKSALATGPADPGDGDYGIKLYFAKAGDPMLSIQYGSFSSFVDGMNPAGALKVPGPASMKPPAGSDGTVILVDADRHYAYEMLQFSPKGATTAYATNVSVVDLTSAGMYKNVGVTAAGLPGIGGLLKAEETARDIEIRHKLWLAVNPDMLFAKPVWPAVAGDVGKNGRYAAVAFGDVVALTRSFDLDHNDCALSPFVRRIAKVLQDYGAIVQDSGGDAFDFVAEVNSVKNYIDVDYDTMMWMQFACLKNYLVKVDKPWDGATPGGLGN